MTRPPLRTFIAGHAISVFAAAGLAALSLWVFVNNTDAWPMLAISGMMMAKVMEAHEAIIAFKDWQATWNAMAPDGAPRRRSRRRLLALPVVGFAAYLAVTVDSEAIRHTASSAVPLAVFFSVIAVPVLGIRWVWKRRSARRSSPVVAVIARRTMPAPKMADAYATLPPYCLALLRGQQ